MDVADQSIEDSRWHRGRTLIAVVAAAAAVIISARLLTNRDADQSDAASTTPITARATTVDATGSTGSAPHALTVTVDLDLPDDAVEMQVTFDPTWQDAAWSPAADTASVGVSSYGYQILFVRSRDGSGEVGDVVPIGVDVIGPDTDEFGVPTPRLGIAGPTTLVVEISNGRLVRGALGEPDRLIGALEQTVPPVEGWTVDVEGTNIDVASVWHITRPRGSGRAENGDILTATTHLVMIETRSELTAGSTYRIEAPSGYLRDEQDLPGLLNDGRAWSPNIHINQVGYAPSDLRKMAIITEPLGISSPIAPDWAPGFSVISAGGQSVFDGVAAPSAVGPDGELGRGDLTGTQAWELDFSELTTPGSYRICVAGVGCSETFRVAGDVWSSVAFSVARAMYHQRSGTALGPPYTSFERPESYTPAVGVEVFATGYSRLDGLYADPEAVFDGVRSQATDVSVDNAVGGHYDAGDWDRRIDHMAYVQAAIAAYEVNPSFWQAADLNLPESGDQTPDILDEALWTLDFFGRLQLDDGSVRGGIEAVSHPIPGTVSWEEELDVYAFAPDPYSSYAYAAAAAEMATALVDVDADRAASLVAKAERAFAWAEDQPLSGPHANAVVIQRGTAAVAIYRHTGDSRFHEIFLETSPFEQQGPLDYLECHGADTWCDGAWIYARIADHDTSPVARENAVQSFRNSADAVIEAAETTRFGWTIEDPRVPLVWGLGPGGAPRVTTVLRAYLLTDDARYLDAAQQSAAFSLGMNPTNQVYVTGIGRNGVSDPLIVDVNQGAVPVWPGTPVYGLHQLNGDYGWADQYFIGPAGSSPGAYDSPFTWSYFDIHDLPFTSEFTVHQSHAPALFAYGTLAALGSLD